MPMPAARTDDWTIDMLDALADTGERHELIDGELFVTPAPSGDHQSVVFELAAILRDYVRTVGGAKVAISPSDVWRSDRKKNRVQPDVFVLRRTGEEKPPYPYHLRDIMLAIEVASPGNPLLDYQVKRDLYLREGVPEYWVVNVEARNVSRWRGSDDPGDVLSRRVEWAPATGVIPFVLELQPFFDNALL